MIARISNTFLLLIMSWRLWHWRPKYDYFSSQIQQAILKNWQVQLEGNNFWLWLYNWLLFDILFLSSERMTAIVS
jgi:hypothetical protein